MAKFSNDFYRALRGLQSNGAFVRLLEGLTGLLDTLRKQNDFLEGTELYRNQGRAQLLSEILEASGQAEKAEKNLEGGGPSLSAIT